MIDLNTLVGLFGGSLATLLAKEVLNQINKKQDFTRELRKLTYMKKLEKAENAIAFYWTYLDKLIQMKKSLEFVVKAINEIEKKDYDIEIIQEVLNKVGQEITNLYEEKYSGVNSIHLYFDIEDTAKWNEQDMENLLTALSETKSIDDEIIFWINLHNNALKANDNRQANIYWNKTTELLSTYINSMQNLIYCIERNQEAIQGIVDKIKQDLKQY